MSYQQWSPVQGEEVQVRFPCGLVEIGKFIGELDEGSCVCRVGKRRYTFQKQDVSQNWPAYKKVKQEKEDGEPSKKSSRRDEDYDEKNSY